LVWDESDETTSAISQTISINIVQPVEHPTNMAVAMNYCNVTCELDAVNGANALIVSEFGSSGDITATLNDVAKTITVTSIENDYPITGLVYFTCYSDNNVDGNSLVPGGTWRDFVTVESIGVNVCWDDVLTLTSGPTGSVTIPISALENQPESVSYTVSYTHAQSDDMTP